MDDTLEYPKPAPNLNISGERRDDEDAEQDAASDDDDDRALDWTKLPYVSHHDLDIRVVVLGVLKNSPRPFLGFF
jgi:hypothetical protein